MNTLRITNGRVIDPSQGIDQITDLWIRGGHIQGLGPQRLVYGSGAHDRRAATRAAGQYAAIRESALPEDVKAQILWGNAAALLKLAAPADT